MIVIVHDGRWMVSGDIKGFDEFLIEYYITYNIST